MGGKGGTTGGGSTQAGGGGRIGSQDHEGRRTGGRYDVTNFPQPAPPPTPAPPANDSLFPDNFFEDWLLALQGGGGAVQPTGPVHRGSSGPSQAELDEQNRITTGENNRDSLYNDYLSAADTATNFINEQIAQERANAALRGVDYSITDADKSTRINNYFSTIWTSGDQTSLDQAFSEFGQPEGFEDFIVTRGDATSGATESAAGEDEVIASSQGVADPTSLLDEDEETLDNASLLGA